MRIFVLCLLFLGSLTRGESLDNENVLDRLKRSSIYFSIGSAFETLSNLARFSSCLCRLLPQTAISENECLLFGDLCSRSAKLAYIGRWDKLDWEQTWQQNRALLSQIPVYSQDDSNLLHFLENRWLAKLAGITKIGLDWVYPCYGISLQANPLSNHAYARLPSSNMTEIYKKRMEAWMLSFAQPLPLILTRSADIRGFLPKYFSVDRNENPDAFANELEAKAIVDLTEFLSSDDLIISDWKKHFSNSCFARNLNLNEIICVEKVQGEEIGGIRIHPLPGQSSNALTEQYDYLLELIGTLGLAASKIELDRGSIFEALSPKTPFYRNNLKNRELAELTPAKTDFSIASGLICKAPDRNEFLSLLDSLETKCINTPDCKNILIEGTFRVLKGLFANLSEQKWQSVLASPTKSSIAQLSMLKINQQLRLLSENLAEPMYESALRLEQVHADFAALLEILAPYTCDDFSKIYRDLVAIPDPLKPLASYGIHISAMNSLTAIIKAVERDSGAVHAIYGENTYYECAKALKKLAQSSSRADIAREEDWKRANLLIAQCNPALRIEIQDDGYKVEKIEERIRKCLSSRSGIPLTLVLDGTLDFIASPKVAKILEEFSKEILEGALTVAVIRSGNKFDLLGMDNYCGAPFFLIQSRKPAYDFLFSDPALQCDPLSLNWFCLAYGYAAPQLERYKKQIFINTRSLLDKVPETLKAHTSSYRVIPMASEFDPSFVDIKIAGPFQKMKAAGLVLPFLLIESMEKGHPIFNRPSLGFYHPNATVIFEEECSTIRLTLGLEPAQVDVFAKCLETIGSLR